MEREVDGIRHRDRSGKGHGLPILLLHGTGGLAEEMEISSLPALLAEHRRVVVPDRPGYGSTRRPAGGRWSPEREADLLHILLDRLAIDRVIVAAHSWATFTALAMAIARPGRVAGLVLMSGYYFDDRRRDLRLVPLLKVPGVRSMVFGVMRGSILRAAVRRVFAPNPVPASFGGFPVAAARLSQRAMVEDAGLMRAAARRLAPLYRAVTAPTLVITGSQDRMVDPVQSLRVARAIPHATLRVAEGVGHTIHHVAPSETAAAIAGLCARLDAGEATAACS